MPTSPAPHTDRNLAAIVLMSMGAFVAFLDVTIVNIAFPDIARSFDGSDIADLSWVLNAYNVVFAALLVVAGQIADLVGRRRMYVVGLAIFTGASALCAVAGSPGQLIAARVLQAAGAAIVVPTSLALLLAHFPSHRRAAAVAIWTAVAAVASGIGPTLGGALIEIADWRAVFLVNVPVGLVAVPLAYRMLRESREEGVKMPDLLCTVLLAGAVASLALAIVQGESWGWGSPRVIGAFAAAVVLAVLDLRRTARQAQPVVAPAPTRSYSFAAANVATLVLAAAFYGAILCNVLFLTSVWHLSVLEAGLMVTPAPLLEIATAILSERFARRWGEGTVIALGALALACGMTWFVTNAGLTSAFATQWLPGIVLVGAGIGLAFPALGNVALSVVPARRLATASAVNATARQIGAVLGIAVLVAILGSTGAAQPAAFDRGWTVCAVLAVVVALAALVAAFVAGRARRTVAVPARNPA